mgnify:CR=1 FL=1
MVGDDSGRGGWVMQPQGSTDNRTNQFRLNGVDLRMFFGIDQMRSCGDRSVLLGISSRV